MNLLSSLVLAALVGASDAAVPASRAFVPKVAVTKALSVRGGAGPLDVDTTAKVATGIWGVQTLYGMLAPEKNMEAYEMGEGDDLTIWLMESAHAVGFGVSIAMYSMLFHDMSAIKALGAGMLSSVLFNLKSVFNDTASKVGMAPAGQWLNLVINSFVAHAYLTDADYANTAMKVQLVWVLLAGAQCRFAPNACLKAWGAGDEVKVTDTTLFATKILGHYVLGSAAFVGSIVGGVEASKSVGYFCAATFLSLLELVTSGATEDMAMTPTYVWFALLLVFIGTLAV